MTQPIPIQDKAARAKRDRVIMAVVLLLIPLGAEIYGIYALAHHSAVASWPTTRGVITRSEMTTQYLPRATYFPEIHYKYSVNGVEYSATAAKSEGGSKFRDEIEQLVQKY